MRATLNIPDDHIVEALKVIGEKSKTKTITAQSGSTSCKKNPRPAGAAGGTKIDYDWKKAEECELKAQRERERILERKKLRDIGRRGVPFDIHGFIISISPE